MQGMQSTLLVCAVEKHNKGISESDHQAASRNHPRRRLHLAAHFRPRARRRRHDAGRQQTRTRRPCCWRLRGTASRRLPRRHTATHRAASRSPVPPPPWLCPPDELVVGKTVLGHSIPNDEPRHGGKCSVVGALTGEVPPCLGGPATVFHGNHDSFYYEVHDRFAKQINRQCDVRLFRWTKGGGLQPTQICRFRELLDAGPPFKVAGTLDLQTLLAERTTKRAATLGKAYIPPQPAVSCPNSK